MPRDRWLRTELTAYKPRVLLVLLAYWVIVEELMSPEVVGLFLDGNGMGQGKAGVSLEKLIVTTDELSGAAESAQVIIKQPLDKRKGNKCGKSCKACLAQDPANSVSW